MKCNIYCCYALVEPHQRSRHYHFSFQFSYNFFFNIYSFFLNIYTFSIPYIFISPLPSTLISLFIFFFFFLSYSHTLTINLLFSLPFFTYFSLTKKCLFSLSLSLSLSLSQFFGEFFIFLASLLYVDNCSVL